MSHFSSKRLLQAQRVKLNNVKNKPALVSSTGKGRVNFRLINRRVYKPKQAVASAVVALIQSWNLFDTLLTAELDTEFGKSIAMSEDGTFIAVIAQDTPSQQGTTNGKGSLHIFKLNNNGDDYDEVSTHYPSGNDKWICNVGVPSAISISDDGLTVIYSEMDMNTNTGSGIVLRKNTNNNQFAQIHRFEGINGDNGAVVAISGNADRVVVSSHNTKDIQIFKLNAGTGLYAKEGQTISNANANITEFGKSIAFNTDGSRLVVGTNNGFYIFGTIGAGGTWASVQELLGNAGTSGFLFGFRVAISGNGECIVVSLPNENQGNINVYKKDASVNTFTLDTTINSTYGGQTQQFGYTLDISKDGSKIIVGNPSYDTPNNNNGMIIVYKKDGNAYVVDDKIITGEAASERFGKDVAISNNGMIIVGSSCDANSDKGFVRIFKLE
tara:strand:- start:2202 stop:3521 length:1320 start_codon:yes stop_codon:yes gene_type:complete